jgi:hypothetical protein
MNRRTIRARLALILSLALVGTSVACSVVPEEKLVRDFFRASRLRDNAALGSFATASFDPQTDGQVSTFKVVSVSPERITPYQVKQFAKAFDEAKAAEDAFSKEKRNYQNANIDAIQRVVDSEGSHAAIGKKDVPIQEAWNKWREDASKHAKTTSDARVQLGRVKGLAELSLSQPNGPTPDVTTFDGQQVEKDVTVDATVKSPDGKEEQKTLVVTVERCVGKDAAGKEINGRWIVTHIHSAKDAPKT